MEANPEISPGTGPYLILDYLYRDASNYKSFGSIWLTGTLSDSERAQFITCLDGGEFFVAEQVGIPALYSSLFEYGAGPTEDDHAWHTFEGFRNGTTLAEDAKVWGDASALLKAFGSAKQNWRPDLSPNFDW